MLRSNGHFRRNVEKSVPARGRVPTPAVRMQRPRSGRRMCAARARHNNQYLRSSSLDSLVYLRPVADSSRVASHHLERFTRHGFTRSRAKSKTRRITPHRTVKSRYRRGSCCACGPIFAGPWCVGGTCTSAASPKPRVCLLLHRSHRECDLGKTEVRVRLVWTGLDGLWCGVGVPVHSSISVEPGRAARIRAPCRSTDVMEKSSGDTCVCTCRCNMHVRTVRMRVRTVHMRVRAAGGMQGLLCLRGWRSRHPSRTTRTT